MFRHMITLCSLVILAVLSVPAALPAQNTPDPSPDEKKLEGLFEEGKYFYRKAYNEKNLRWEYAIVVESGGETAIINCYLMKWGTRPDSTPVNIVYFYTKTAEFSEAAPLSPEVIKYVASVNDAIMVGNVSANTNTIFVNAGTFIDDMSVSTLHRYISEIHSNRAAIKKEIDKIRDNS